jgi:leader peptidase (prepilin peptidase) / N-methyltransferase
MLVYFIVIGLLIGSFLNVCIFRIPRKESIAWPASHCPGCGYVLKWYDLVPVLSYILLRGKCRQCRSHITLRYPVIELVTGIVFTLLYFKYGFTWLLLSRLVFACLLIVVAFTDLEHYIIPNVVVVPGALLGLASSFLPGAVSPLNSLGAGIGAALFFLVIWLVYPKGMGLGDVKLALMLGTFLGWAQVALAIFLASLIGTLIGGALILIKGKRILLPFGLFLAIGSLMSLLYGQELLSLYLGIIGWK